MSNKKPYLPSGHDGGFPLGPADLGWRIKTPPIKVELEGVAFDPFDTKKWRDTTHEI